MIRKTIIADFFTTVSFSQFLQSLYLMTIWLPFLRYWKDLEKVEWELLEHIDYFYNKTLKDERKVVSFYNWRSAIYHTLRMIWVWWKDEVIVSGYNCVSVSNAVLQSWAKIVYCDVDENNLRLDFDDLKSKITENTKVIIVQHTFGKVLNVEKIMELASLKGILVIEDCAHSLGTVVSSSGSLCLKGKSCIKWVVWRKCWDFAIFSTGRDKSISGITGGFLVVNNSDYFRKVEDIKKRQKMPSVLLVFRNLLYNVFGYLAYKTYDCFELWKVIIFLSRKLSFITEILTSSEKNCNFSEFDYSLPNSLAYLVRKELYKIGHYNYHRRRLAKIYNAKFCDFSYPIVLLKEKKKEVLNYFRYPILCKDRQDREELVRFMKKRWIILWTSWTWKNIVPVWTDLRDAKYERWTCRVSEDISDRIVFLPNHKLVTNKDVSDVINLINKYYGNVQAWDNKW